ncbi:hypothetical protein MTO96_037296 [Rhipicephalus appendiculatus]
MSRSGLDAYKPGVSRAILRSCRFFLERHRWSTASNAIMSPGAAEADGMSGPARLRGFSAAAVAVDKRSCHPILVFARWAPRGPSTEFFQELRFEMSIRYPGGLLFAEA